MWLLSASVVLAILKLLSYQGVLNMAFLADISWWWVFGGFALTSLWFYYADASGLTNRRAMERIEQQKQERINKQRELLRPGRKR